MTSDEEKSKLDSVEQTLNKKDDRYFFRRRSSLGHAAGSSHDDWHDALPSTESSVKKKHTFAKKLFLAALVFFLAALLFAFLRSQGGGTVISDQNIDLQMTGPLSVKSGEALQIQLQLVNNNPVPLEVSSLIIMYPPGTRNPDSTREVTRQTKDLGDIAPRQVINDIIHATLFGEEKSEQEIKVEFEYHLPGSGAVYVKEVSYHVTIDSAPVSLRVNAPDTVTSGDKITFVVDVESNSGKLVPALSLKINYPPGFVFASASPVPATGTNNIWSLGDISASSSRSVTIIGTMGGQDNDSKVFQVIAGTAVGGRKNDVTLVYNSIFQKITLSKPLLGLSLAANGKLDTNVFAEAQAPIDIVLAWANNTPGTLSDCSLTANLGGEFDRYRVKLDPSGNYFSADNRIVWNNIGAEKLRVVSPGESGEQHLTITSLPLAVGATTLKRPTITIGAGMMCAKLGEANTKNGTLEAAADRTIRIHTDAQFSVSARYFTGPFTNTGPFPPKADTDTDFTIMWSLTNTSNDVQAATVVATLPPYATWKNISVGDGSLIFDPKTRQVLWAVGTLKAGVGYDSPAKKVSFQVSIKPPVTAIGSVVTIIDSATFTGIDDFTKVERKSIKNGLTTALKFDPGMPDDVEGKVE